MTKTLQDRLLSVPLHQITFITPLPKGLIFYETISEVIPEQPLDLPTLLVIRKMDEWQKLNEAALAVQLIQDPNIKGFILALNDSPQMQLETFSIFQQCQIPFIQLRNEEALQWFQSDNHSVFSFSQLSMELNGLKEKGFTEIASGLAMALETAILYLDENDQLLWQTGFEVEIRKANQWFIECRKNSNHLEYANLNHINSNQPKSINESYERYAIQVTEVFSQSLVVSAHLADWQKKLIDKLVGVTALLLQTEEIFQEQQRQFKEHFIYDLLYHKFESKKVMIKQGKAWGWNLERPHHLLVIHFELLDEFFSNLNWLEELTYYLESEISKMSENMILFPFEDQVVVLIEDETERNIGERKSFIMKLALQLERLLVLISPQYKFFIGIGKWYQDTTFLNKSYQEAQLAIRFGQKWFETKWIFHINDLGILHLLINIHQEILYDYSQDYLFYLIKADNEQGTEYIKTLIAFIQHQGIINEIADHLYVHPNTLRKRLKKVEDLTGVNVQDPEEFMNLAVAVKLHSIMNK